MADTAASTWRAKVLDKARTHIGTPYDQLDCSHFVQLAYDEAGLRFPYTATVAFESVLVGTYFKTVTAEAALPGDLILYSGHVGILDPDGCTTVHTASASKYDCSDMRVLSARSGRNLGVEYGRSSWFGSGKYLTWTGPAAP